MSEKQSQDMRCGKVLDIAQKLNPSRTVPKHYMIARDITKLKDIKNSEVVFGVKYIKLDVDYLGRKYRIKIEEV